MAPTPFMQGDGRWAALPNQGALRWQPSRKAARKVLSIIAACLFVSAVLAVLVVVTK